MNWDAYVIPKLRESLNIPFSVSDEILKNVWMNFCMTYAKQGRWFDSSPSHLKEFKEWLKNVKVGVLL